MLLRSDRGIRPVGLQQGRFQLDPTLAAKARPGGIRCPYCKWQPTRSSRWYCLPCGHPEYLEAGCGTAWNTFDTRGRCPTCSYQWRNTSCLACSQWSAHEDWYVQDEGGDPVPGP